MITDNSYDYLRGAIDAFDMLDATARNALFEELRGMLSTVMEIQTKNEKFKREYYSHYALLESSVDDQRKQIKELEAQNAELGAKNFHLVARVAQLEVEIDNPTMQVKPAVAHTEPVARQ